MLQTICISTIRECLADCGSQGNLTAAVGGVVVGLVGAAAAAQLLSLADIARLGVVVVVVPKGANCDNGIHTVRAPACVVLAISTCKCT